jgi:uncharacterized protein with von Willebrand factor type A (vWA) domain
MESERIVTGFVQVLRANGLSVTTGMAILFAEAVALLGVGIRTKVYWAGRATLVRRVEDIPAYDRAFAAYWQDRPATVEVLVEAAPLTLALDDGEAPTGDVLTVRYSPAEILRHQDMSALTQAEWAEAQRLISALGIAAELQLSRRTRPSRRRSRGHPDLRGTLRRNMRFGGVPIRRAWRSPVTRPRRLVLLLDVSGSMAPYARGLARFAHAAVGSRRSGRVEVFTIGTRLTRITRELTRRDPDAALASAAESVADWSGGTRLGASLAEFNARWGIKGMARGAVVVILSDGWDRGDPAVIGAEMARLSRVARRVVWVNPLKASPGYAPLARGMAAALPFVDQFVEGHAVSSLERLADIIGGTPTREPRP